MQNKYQKNRELIKNELLINSSNFRKISLKLGVSEDLVGKVAKSVGVESRNSRIKNLESEMERLFLEGNNITEIGKKLGVWYNRVGEYIKSKGYMYSPCGKKDINSSIFSVINTEDKAYWLGFLYADGNVSKKGSRVELSLQEKDLNHLEKFKMFLDWKGNIHFLKKVKAYKIQFEDKQIYSDLTKLGCIPAKSLILTFPSFNEVPEYLINHFIRGYFDGDGYISNPNNKPICSQLIGTYNMLYNIHKIIDLPIENIKHRDGRHSKEVYTNSLTGDNARKFMSFIHKNSTICLERKKERYNNHLKKYDKSRRITEKNN